MLTTIIAIILTLLPGMFLVYLETKEKEKRKKGEERREKARNRISFKAIESRFPFVSLLEFYYLKKRFYPHFAKTGLSRDDAWQMRKELYREIVKRVKS
ncbi:MAG: hypothetical protein KAQ85_04355 [Thermodesulfovibrionia bacterium]|nr:hypothetical protein [Thermodesulfovibrionia bacterium]